jgi:hypothetical protein
MAFGAAVLMAELLRREKTTCDETAPRTFEESDRKDFEDGDVFAGLQRGAITKSFDGARLPPAQRKELSTTVTYNQGCVSVWSGGGTEQGFGAFMQRLFDSLMSPFDASRRDAQRPPDYVLGRKADGWKEAT